MRETRNAQSSIFDIYSEHEHARQLRVMSELSNEHPITLTLTKQDFANKQVTETGALGLSLESILRCLLLNQQLMLH